LSLLLNADSHVPLARSLARSLARTLPGGAAVGAVFAVNLCFTIPALCFMALVPFREHKVLWTLSPFFLVIGFASCAFILWALFS
jgi:hypothetical protein